MNKGSYASWGDFSVLCNENKKTFSLKLHGKTNAINNLRIDSVTLGNKKISLSKFKKCKCKIVFDDANFNCLIARFSKGCEELPSLKVKFIVNDNGIRMVIGDRKGLVANISGELNWGNNKIEDVYPVSSKKNGDVVRVAVGPASSNKDDMLFDRLTDSAISFLGFENTRIIYDWNKKKYLFKAVSGKTLDTRRIDISVQEKLLTNEYKIEYAPLNKNCTFSKPPAGWMTWYAVKFDAGEEKVLKNAKWMSDNLKEYGADCVWVDWEWYHKDMKGVRDDGCDTFNPDKEKYPHGLKYVSDKIKEMGLTPALWIGFTCDPGKNEYIKENPEIILVEENWWCGRYFLDFSHPKYLNEFLPKALSQVFEWGYEAVKFDTLPITMIKHDLYHQNMYDPTLTTKEAYRRMIKKARSVLGKDMYMLSCAAINDRDVLWAADLFDSARIGGDIFGWEEFLKQGVEKTLRYYSLHNNVLYPDSDNIILREEFNDIRQAASRIYFVSILGIPMTFGDEFDALDEKRIEFIKECLPILETHPMDICKHKLTGDVLKINLAINKEWESYNVVNVFNTTSETKLETVKLKSDFGLDDKEYIVYNYTDNEFVGITDESFEVKLDSCESKIFCIREKFDRPQLISTSRHISQGAAEITDMEWNDSRQELVISAELIKNAPYIITLYVPEGFVADGLTKVSDNIYAKTIIPEVKKNEIKIMFN